VSHLDSDTIALIALGEGATPIDNEHIAQCPKCQSELDEFRSVVASARSITDADRPVAPPTSVWLGIEQAIAADSLTNSPVVSTPSRKGAGWYALAASVGVVIGGLATFVAMQSTTSTQTPSVIAQASLEPLRDVEQPAQAVVQQVDGKDVLVVQASGLPATDGYYEVWLLAPDAQSMVSVGMLDSTEGGTFPLPAGLDLNQFPVVDVSLEHFDGDASHSADSILRGQLEI
jgi:Anti-sigma-K factor rskA